MEGNNYTQAYSSYPDSHDSSPRSREIDCDNLSNQWDDPSVFAANNYKVKFMCSYGGKIHPRPHDNQLAYVGGDTKILAFDRNVRFITVVTKLGSITDTDVCFKYQLPGEDLDALISVTNDEDLEHMMLEYDRMQRTSVKPARLRVFLFPVVGISSGKSSFSNDGGESAKSSQQWFVDALNSVPSMDSSMSPQEDNNTDFLFGTEKPVVVNPMVVETVEPPVVLEQVKIIKAPSQVPPLAPVITPDVVEVPVSPAEIQRQIPELQRLHIATQGQHQHQQQQQQMHQHQQQQQQQHQIHQQAIFQREKSLARAFQGDYYVQEKLSPPVQPVVAPVTPTPVQMQAPVTMALPTGNNYWQQQQQQQDPRHVAVATNGYTTQVTQSEPSQAQAQAQQQVYLIPAGGGMYSAGPNNMRPVAAGQGGGYYQMQPRMVQEVYNREPATAMYNMGPPVQQQSNTAGYAQVGYDNTGRQVYYSPAPQQVVAASGGAASQYQTVVATTAAAPLENKVVVKTSLPQASG